MAKSKRNFSNIYGDRNILIQDNLGKISINILENTKKETPKNLNFIPSIDIVKECIGRHEELIALDRLLFNSSLNVLIYGVGGIGKTTFATAYVSHFKTKFNHLIWLNYSGDLKSDIGMDSEILMSLQINTNSCLDLDTRIGHMLYYIRNLQGDNLLVIDNANHEMVYSEIFKNISTFENWKTIVICRYELPTFSCFELEPLRQIDAEKLFYSIYDLSKSKELSTLLNYIGCHTLTIELLAKTILRKRGLIDIQMLTKLLKKRKLTDIEFQDKIWTRHSGEEKGVLITLQRLFDFSKLSEKELFLLQQLSILPSISIDIFKLVDLFNIENYELIDLLNNLIENGWIYFKNKGFLMHRSVQEIVLYTTNPKEKEIKSTIEFIRNKINRNEKDILMDKDSILWLSFSDKLKDFLIDNIELSESSYCFLFQYSIVLDIFGQYAKAVQILETILRDLRLRFNQEYWLIEEIEYSLAKEYIIIGKYDDALGLIKYKYEKINIEEQNIDDYVALVSLLIAGFRGLGQFQRAADLGFEALIRVKEFNIDNFKIIPIQSNLAAVLRSLGDLNTAAKYYEMTLHENVKYYGENHPSTIQNQSNLAMIYCDLEDYEYAEAILRDAIVKDMKYFTVNHPKSAIRQLNLAKVLIFKKEFEEAKILLEYSFSIFNIVFGENHPYTLTAIELIQNSFNSIEE